MGQQVNEGGGNFRFWRSGLRRWAPVVVLAAAAVWAWVVWWRPGVDVQDGRHDRGSNGVWLAHGWLGGDDWFERNGKLEERERYRDPARIGELARSFRARGVTDVFPHLCPADSHGGLPPVDSGQVERFLDLFQGLRVVPWVGGVNGGGVRLDDVGWRRGFVLSIGELLVRHQRLAGVQLNVEPLPSGDGEFLLLLEEVRAGLPPGRILSVAAYPPPTRAHPFPEVHWDESYFREVARRSDQMVVMMYDAGQRWPKAYQRLMATWTREVLDWSEGKAVLLGVPTYEDAGSGYHDPGVENLTNGLLGIHRGLSDTILPEAYQGVAIYCDWETSEEEWAYWKEHFLRVERAGDGTNGAAGPR